MLSKGKPKAPPTDLLGQSVSEQAARKWVAPVLEALGCCYSCLDQKNGLKLVATDGTGPEVIIQIYNTGMVVAQGKDSPLLEAIKAIVIYKFRTLPRGRKV